MLREYRGRYQFHIQGPGFQEPTPIRVGDRGWTQVRDGSHIPGESEWLLPSQKQDDNVKGSQHDMFRARQLGQFEATRWCHHCGTRYTSEWRRGPEGLNTLCNACGLQYAKVLKIDPGSRNAGSINFILNDSDDKEEGYRY
eukprot:TRINITY_DN5226_c0_g1_i1.p1 TRINITY_DN5226_c0_g1~~TRINITY_DN5226_c0_g1_i1.p1  ORF type:complete len:141 (+),score=21.28 TRINITY_DN5226_c0_g1_i1:64-486(+)